MLGNDGYVDIRQPGPLLIEIVVDRPQVMQAKVSIEYATSTDQIGFVRALHDCRCRSVGEGTRPTQQ
jgi:hypothetical protein